MLQQEGSFGATRATFAEMKTPLAGLLSRSYVGRIFLALRRLHFCNSAAARVGAGNGLETRCGRRQDRHRDPKPPGPSYRPEASPLFARSPHRVVRTPGALHLGTRCGFRIVEEMTAIHVLPEIVLHCINRHEYEHHDVLGMMFQKVKSDCCPLPVNFFHFGEHLSAPPVCGHKSEEADVMINLTEVIDQLTLERRRIDERT